MDDPAISELLIELGGAGVDTEIGKGVNVGATVAEIVNVPLVNANA